MRSAILGAVAKRTGMKLLSFDRRLGVRFVAGADEAGRGPLAGPLVVAGVLLDLDSVREHRARPSADVYQTQRSRARRQVLRHRFDQQAFDAHGGHFCRFWVSAAAA